MASTSKQEWNDTTLERLKKRFGERRESFETDSALKIDTLYTPEDLESIDYD